MYESLPVDFLREIAQGILRSPFQIVLFFMVVIFFIIILSFTTRMARRNEERMTEIVHSSAYQRYLHQYDLSSVEINIIETLAAYLKDRRKKYLLLNNQKTFTACLYMYQKEHGKSIAQNLLGPLFRKLGFDPSMVPVIIRTSRDMLPGSPLVLIDGQGLVLNGKTIKVLDNSLIFESETPLPEVDGQKELKAFTNNFTGLIEMQMKVQKREGNQLYLSHSDSIKRNQPQSFSKKKWNIPVMVKREGFIGKSFASKIISLNSKGLILVNPEKKFRVGDDLRLSLSRGANPVFHLYGEVTKTSRNRTILVVEFGHLDADEKERIKAIMSSGTV